MTHLVEVLPLLPGTDPASRSVLAEAQHLGARGLRAASVSRLFRLSGSVSVRDAETIGRELLSDPITETVRMAPASAPGSVDIWYKANVTDPAAGTIETALLGMGYPDIQVRCGLRVRFEGERARTLEPLIGKFLANAVIQDWTVTP